MENLVDMEVMEDMEVMVDMVDTMAVVLLMFMFMSNLPTMLVMKRELNHNNTQLYIIFFKLQGFGKVLAL